jgi:hypothetical protein
MRKKCLSVILAMLLVLSCIAESKNGTAFAGEGDFNINGKPFPTSNYPADGRNPWCSCGIAIGNGGHAFA